MTAPRRPRVRGRRASNERFGVGLLGADPWSAALACTLRQRRSSCHVLAKCRGWDGDSESVRMAHATFGALACSGVWAVNMGLVTNANHSPGGRPRLAYPMLRCSSLSICSRKRLSPSGVEKLGARLTRWRVSRSRWYGKLLVGVLALASAGSCLRRAVRHRQPMGDDCFRAQIESRCDRKFGPMKQDRPRNRHDT